MVEIEAEKRTAGAECRELPFQNQGNHLDLDWVSQLSAEEWSSYQKAIHALRDAGINFILGGGFALAAFTGRWRNTKDIDFYIMPGDREKAVAQLEAAGFRDYFPERAYDRSWIHRSTENGVIVDLIWSMANHRAEVDALFFERARRISLRGESLLLMPIEEFLWCKIYIVQRDRCDWIDVINLVYTNGANMDWEHLLYRMGEDKPLLQGMLAVFGWLHPERALLVPQWVRDAVGVSIPRSADTPKWRERARYLDLRAWFTALKPRGEQLEV